MIAHEQLSLFQRQSDEFWRFTLAQFEAKGGTVACKAGCVHCCKAYAQCSDVEADQIAAAMRADPDGLGRYEARINAYLRELADKWRAAGDPVPDFEKRVEMHFGLNMRCPFLTDGDRCAVYEMRPQACRTHWAAGTNELCKSPATVSKALKIAPTEESTRMFVEALRQEGRTEEYASYDRIQEALSQKGSLTLIAAAVKRALMRQPSAESRPERNP